MSHYFENDNNVKSNERIIYAKVNDIELKFIADNGVFSKKGLDFGTRTLLENVNISNSNCSILDFGCGYGPIGIYLSKKFNINVDMIDINKRAINLTLKNAELNKVNVNAFESNIYSNVSKKYDYIVKKVLYQILFEAKQHLNQNGELWLVINKNQGAKSLFTDLKKEYNAFVVNKNKGFYIIRAINN